MAFQWKYDVFLSFRGADTRKGLTDHLYHALERAGIHTFRDDKEIDNGEEIGEACLKAIQESKFSIVVLTKRYASSSWCLDELVHIIRCRKEMGEEVWPVFYDVDDPSDVEEIKGSFGEAFEKMIQESHGVDEQRVQGWKAALKEVCYLKGLDLQKHEDGHEARNIDNIVKEILSKLDRVPLNLPSKEVCLHSRAEDVISLMARKSVDVCVVGICGMAGIGKTTIAKKVYNLAKDKFSSSCFLQNVRENSGSKGIAKLQTRLLSDTLQRKYEKIYNVDHGVSVIKERLRYKQVLIVLDDIDDVDQVHNILGGFNWLFPGSKVIITTRVKDLMPSAIYAEYMVSELNEQDAMQLLCLHAFDERYPLEGYESCASEAVQYAGGVPLALQILGSALQGQSIDTWNDRLEKLKQVGDQKIQEVLQISYKSLDDADKFLFLDIVCFFVGKEKDYVINILEDSGFLDGISTLLKRCLLKIESNRLWMHDLVRDMGRAIVRQQCPADPSERSRIWKHADAVEVLKCQTGTKAVEGLMLDEPHLSDSFDTKSFKKMKRLRLLQLNYAYLSGSFEYIPRQLRWLCWRQFPLDSIPTDLDLGNLKVLDMRYSSLKIFSEDMKALKKLKVLNLSHSRELTKSPNFECMPNLENLILKGCSSLAEVHDSIGLLVRLVYLDLKDCKSLRNLPRTVGALRSLKSLNIAGCSNVEDLPEEVGSIKSLVEVIADGTAISTLPESIRNLENLLKFSVVGCCQMFSSENRLHFTSGLPACLTKLDLSDCGLTDDTFPQDLHVLRFLREFSMGGNKFTNLPACIGSLPWLFELNLPGCKNLKSVPKLGSSLSLLTAEDCSVLESIDLSNSNSFRYVCVKKCHRLKVIKGCFDLEASEARQHMIKIMTKANSLNSCQKGTFEIFLDQKEIPSWFCLQNGGDTICFDVPPLDQGSKLVGLIACAIVILDDRFSTTLSTSTDNFKDGSFTCIRVINKTKSSKWLHEPKCLRSFGRNASIEFYSTWLSSWMFANESSDDPESRSRFWEEVEGGDLLEISFGVYYIFKLLKCGIQILYQHHNNEVDA